MRIHRILVRSGLTATAAAALPLAPAAGQAAAAGPGITVTFSSSTVQANTTACGGGGDAALLSTGQTTFAQGRRTPLTTGSTQSASWSGVGSGTYTVAVVCSNGTTAGTQSITVSQDTSPTTSSTSSPPPSASPSPSPSGSTSASASASPSSSASASVPPSPSASVPVSPSPSVTRGVMGGLGGGTRDRGTFTTVAGGALVTAGLAGSVWCLSRRVRTKRG
ncbi:hypothetical protein [Streptomyces minutiscleroticus]|uniref:hypothetical protein n=1 Tax=Streptomyces minutiscleroticus TaxID=68238 RepID=UPI00167E316C|nr:hypothetical protein [Streptomyces minutiscleroticus]